MGKCPDIEMQTSYKVYVVPLPCQGFILYCMCGENNRITQNNFHGQEQAANILLRCLRALQIHSLLKHA